MQPEVIATVAALRARLAGERTRGRVIGLVPTMGALHAGHAALIERARRESQCVVVSIFVNPIQFDRREDYAAYTIDLEQDRAYCGTSGADLIFAPGAAEMYPAPTATLVEVVGVSEHLCGKFRPGHFRGVATVVLKLLNIVQPHRAYFGEKDAQQLAVIERMVADLNLPVEIVRVPTVREADGLALSSRNRRLSAAERSSAPALFEALEQARRCIEAGCDRAEAIRRAALDRLEREPLIRVEYLDVVDTHSMTPVDRVTGPVRIAAAVWLGATRLIDNVYAVRVPRGEFTAP